MVSEHSCRSGSRDGQTESRNHENKFGVKRVDVARFRKHVDMMPGERDECDSDEANKNEDGDAKG